MVEDDQVKAVAVIEHPNEEGWQMGAAITLLILKFDAITDVFVVENQQAYGKGKADPNDLIRLSHVAGAAAAAASFRAHRVLFPQPRVWKKGVPKGVHQSRILDQLGWSYTFDGPKRPVKDVVIPEDVDVPEGGISSEHMSEVVDAIGLALWGVSRVAA